MEPDGYIRAISRYAQRLHARAGNAHHVVSALGAWMVLALCADLADDATLRRDLTEVLGVEAAAASAFTTELLEHPHPLVAAATGAWFHPGVSSPRIDQWRKTLPAATETGELPTRVEIDRWCDEHTFGLVKTFPIELKVDTIFILASALATKVSWDKPFEVVDAAGLGQTTWLEPLDWVLRSPKGDPRHRQFIVDAKGVGKAVIHLTSARGGLLVGSVIAADVTVSADEVLEFAHQIVTDEATGTNSTRPLSLFDLPLGEGPLWRITEATVETTARDGREEEIVALLPAWTAETDLDLATEEALGFATTARILAAALGLDQFCFDARQAAVARYSSVGFEAAAITGFAMALSAPQRREGVRRDATVRFAHPYAVVAVTSQDALGRRNASQWPAWRGLPVFSAWVSQPCDASPAES